MSERQRDAEDAHQDGGGDLLHARSFMEAHLPGVDGGASHGSSTEHLRQTLPGKKWRMSTTYSPTFEAPHDATRTASQ